MASPINIDDLSKSEARAMVMAQDRLDWVDMFVDLPSASGDQDSDGLHPNQIFCIGDYHQFQVTEKGRQEGHSFGFALDSIARAVLEPRSQAVHISTDKWDAQKKQIYCLRILESIKSAGKKFAKIKSESKDRIEFANGSLIDFLACRPPRGADRAGVYLDEMAFMPKFATILKAALGCTTHGGYIRGGSTHCGSQTEFIRIVRNLEDETGRKPYQFWSRGYFPWWTCPSLCIDVDAAMREAPGMDTAERIEKFGNDKIKNIFLGYPIVSDFQEEFECMVVDEAHSFFPMSLIEKCIPPKGIDEFFEYVECYGHLGIVALDPAKDIINLLKREVVNGRIRGDLYAAMDIGRKVDKDEITIGNFDNKLLCLRAVISLNNMPFERKEEIWHYMMQELPVVKGYIDATGGSMGVHLSEIMYDRYMQRAMPFQFTNESKALLANDLKIRMEREGLIIPQGIPSLIRQIHAIRKNVTLHGNITYGVEENKEHHGDKFWSLAMLSSLAADTSEVYGFAIEVVTRDNQYTIPNRPTTHGLILPGSAGWTPRGTIR